MNPFARIILVSSLVLAAVGAAMMLQEEWN